MNEKVIAIAPMMNCTDRHFRYLARLISPHCLLYTEMVTTGAILNGDRAYLLAYHQHEAPIVLQLGGSDPQALAHCAKIGEEFGYHEINLNVGCPSPRVKSGRFGACLMLEPALVADCIAAMCATVTIPVTVKTRIGVDEHDSYAQLATFIDTVSGSGCQQFIIHARKAWLQGLSPKQNRHVPPLRYEVVSQLKRDFPQLTFILNGGINTMVQFKQLLPLYDGLMIGRQIYHDPLFLRQIEQYLYPQSAVMTAKEIVNKFCPYIVSQLSRGVKLHHMTRHMVGLFQGTPGAKRWRRYLSQHATQKQAGIEVVTAALAQI